MEAIFALSVIVIVFVYVLYGPIMTIFKYVLKKRRISGSLETSDLPTISVIIPAYNEEAWIEQKIMNSFHLTYPEGKKEIIVVTDGSDDRTNEIASKFGDQILLLHQSARNGKIKAMDRAARIANSEILVFTDANTDLNEDALFHIAKNYKDPEVGMVAGEKKVLAKKEGEAANGEGLYWKYESWLKKLDSEVASVIGAAGELFSIRADLYDSLPGDTLLDDFMLSTRVIEQGYRVVYEPQACAMEYGSVSYKEEWKRKVRICAGGVQSVIRSSRLFNVSRYGLKSFAFTFHRASRWTMAPMALILSYISSGYLMLHSIFYLAFFLSGTFALGLTYLAIEKNIKNLPKPLLLIVYFTFMHLSAIAGWFRYFGKKQHVNWERSLRII
ncbi:MAG: glycosyltransferase family 2 protein [Balneolales bacterium]|nr:glycosyltransferase family 2 protein [Balneolales bacterium]